MLVPLFYAPIVVSIAILAALFIYITFQARNHPVKLLFMGVLLDLGIILYCTLLRYVPPGQAPPGPEIPRLQWAAGSLLIPLFLHFGSFFLPLRHRRWLRWLLPPAYGLALGEAWLFLQSPIITAEADLRVRGPLRLTGYEIAPLGKLIGVLSLLQLLMLLILLFRAAEADAFSLERERARRMRLPAALLLAFYLLSMLALPLFDKGNPLAVSTGLMLNALSYLATVGMGLSASYMVLRYGMPLAEPLDPAELLSALLLLPFFILLSWFSYHLDKAALDGRFGEWIVPPLVLGVILGGLLVRPGRLLVQRLASRLDVRTHPLHQSIQVAWMQIMHRRQDPDTLDDLVRRLAETLGALFVLLARRTSRRAGAGARFRVVARHGDSMNLPSSLDQGLTWEIAELEGPLLAEVPVDADSALFQALHPASLRAQTSALCPIHRADILEGLLIIGHPAHGGRYTSQEIEGALACAEAIAGRWTAEWLEHERLRLSARASRRSRTAPPFDSAETQAAPVRIRTLGRFEATVNGRPIEGGRAITRQAKIALALLVWAGESGLSRQRLQAILWPDQPPSRARNALNVTIHHLRRALEPDLREPRHSRFIIRIDRSYFFRPQAGAWIDSEAFERLCEQGHRRAREGDLEAAIAAFQDALALYQGDYFDDPEMDLPVEVESIRQALRRRFSQACWGLVMAARKAHRGDLVEQALTTLLTHQPWELQACRELAAYYQAQGDTAQAKRYLDLLAAREAELARAAKGS